jgi:hypothetical protein
MIPAAAGDAKGKELPRGLEACQSALDLGLYRGTGVVAAFF